MSGSGKAMTNLLSSHARRPVLTRPLPCQLFKIAVTCLSNTEMSGKRTRETRTAGGNRRQQPQYYCTGTGVVSTLEADASAPLGDLALSSNTAMANACTGDLEGICGGNHRFGVCICVFWVPGSARGVAGRAFPAMLRARARREGGCQFSVMYTGGGGSRNRTVGRGPFFLHRGSTFLCGSSTL